MLEEDRMELNPAQHKMNEIYTNKATGAFTRSRRWWVEGEQNSAYFFNRDKHHGKVNAIQQLNINGTVTDGLKMMADYCSKFCGNVYKSNIVSTLKLPEFP